MVFQVTWYILQLVFDLLASLSLLQKRSVKHTANRGILRHNCEIQIFLINSKTQSTAEGPEITKKKKYKKYSISKQVLDFFLNCIPVNNSIYYISISIVSIFTGRETW